MQQNKDKDDWEYKDERVYLSHKINVQLNPSSYTTLWLGRLNGKPILRISLPGCGEGSYNIEEYGTEKQAERVFKKMYYHLRRGSALVRIVSNDKAEILKPKFESLGSRNRSAISYADLESDADMLRSQIEKEPKKRVKYLSHKINVQLDPTLHTTLWLGRLNGKPTVRISIPCCGDGSYIIGEYKTDEQAEKVFRNIDNHLSEESALVRIVSNDKAEILKPKFESLGS